jgi:hypothetical protein
VKRLGPELKMPKLKGGEMKVPPFLSDLYFDLRDRRLLPLVGLILVAIIATPILLGGGSDETEPAPATGVAGGSTPASEQSLTVVKAQPGLRNYKKRLRHRSPTNPFKQRFNEPRLDSQLNEPTTTTTSTTSSTSTETGGTGSGSETVITGPSGGSGGASPGGGGESGQITFFTFAIDVQVTRAETKPDGSVVESDPTPHEHVLAPATLPGDKAPVITYMGLGAKEHLPMFLISDDVSEIFGDGKCVSGGGICRLIELAPGKPEGFVFGENDVRYKFVVTNIEPVVDGHS